MRLGREAVCGMLLSAMAGCASDPAQVLVTERYLLGTQQPVLDGPLIGLSLVGDGESVQVGGWTRGRDGPGLILLRGSGRLDGRLTISLSRFGGATYAVIVAEAVGASFRGTYRLVETGESTSIELTPVLGVPPGTYQVAITGAFGEVAAGAAGYRCQADGAVLVLADPDGGARLYLRVTAPGPRFSRGSFPLGRPGGHAASIQIGGEPGTRFGFVAGTLTIKQLDNLGLVGRVQGVARDPATGSELTINGTMSAAGADGSCTQRP